jgi:hypothetical protein
MLVIAENLRALQLRYECATAVGGIIFQGHNRLLTDDKKCVAQRRILFEGGWIENQQRRSMLD